MTEPDEQGTHFFFIALQCPLPRGGFHVQHCFDTTTPPEGATRFDAVKMIYEGLVAEKPELAGSVIIAFDIQPNQL